MSESYRCRFCKYALFIEQTTYFIIKQKREEIDILSCRNCRTLFNCAETSGPKSKYRLFLIKESRDRVQEEMMFDNIEFDNDYSENTTYIGTYQPGSQYLAYQLLMGFDLLDIDQMDIPTIERKIKLYMVLS